MHKKEIEQYSSMELQQGNNRETKYDVIRVTAMFSVVLMHLCAHISVEPNGMKWLVKSGIMLLLSTCNGLFFLLSGKFNLAEKNEADPIGFYKRRAKTILIPFLICSFICYLTESSLIEPRDSYFALLATSFPVSHYWFVYELMGLIIWTPFFAAMMNKLDLSKKLIMTVVVLVLQFVFVGLKDIGIYPGYEFPLMGWPLFYLVGNFADDIPVKWKKRIIIIGCICFVLSVIQIWYFPGASQGLQDFSPKYFFFTLALYYGLQLASVPARVEKAVKFIAEYSYYVYLFHNTIILLFFTDKLGVYNFLIGNTGTAIFILAVFLISIGVSLLLGIPVKLLINVIFY